MYVDRYVKNYKETEFELFSRLFHLDFSVEILMEHLKLSQRLEEIGEINSKSDSWKLQYNLFEMYKKNKMYQKIPSLGIMFLF